MTRLQNKLLKICEYHGTKAYVSKDSESIVVRTEYYDGENSTYSERICTTVVEVLDELGYDEDAIEELTS